MYYSIIIPVYNRPNEIKELLDSLLMQTYSNLYEIVIIEDGSTLKSDAIVKQYDSLNITYLFKENSGPGQSRNEGMKIAKGNYFIILDSDVILPTTYLDAVNKSLELNFTDAFTGSDKAHDSFTNIQKAINFSMTSFFTTGGIRSNEGLTNFQLRSFNMGLSKKTFELSKGFSNQNFGEDIDLSFRLEKLKCTKQFISEAFVYHKRRINFKKFYQQTNNFGAARPILNKMHSHSAKMTYWFPTLFLIFFSVALVGIFCQCKLPLVILLVYLSVIFFNSWKKNRSITIALLSVRAVLTQFFGYGLGFLRTQIRLNFLRQSMKESFPKMFS